MLLFSSSTEPFAETEFKENLSLVETTIITESYLNAEMGTEYEDGMFIVKMAQSYTTKTLRLVRAKR